MKQYSLIQVDEVVQALNNHEIIAIPTDTVYGVGVKYGNLEDLEALNTQKIDRKPNPFLLWFVTRL